MSGPEWGISAFGQYASGEYQTFEGIQTAETLVLVPAGFSSEKDDDMGLKIAKISLNGNIQKYLFQTEVHSVNSTIFSDSISLKLDDKIYKLKDGDRSKEDMYDEYFLQIVTYDISPELLEVMKTSKTFGVEIYKRVAVLNEEELQVLKNFLR
jgi:hypothetical protein